MTYKQGNLSMEIRKMDKNIFYRYLYQYAASGSTIAIVVATVLIVATVLVQKF